QLDICLQPRAQRIFNPPARSLVHLVRRFPFMTATFLGLISHVIFSVLNVAFHYGQVLQQMTTEQSNVYRRQLPTISAVAYGLGLALGVYLMWPIIIALHRIHRGQSPPAERLPFLRHRSLRWGDYSLWIGIGLRVAFGLIFPLWLALAGVFVQDGPLHS